MMKKTFLLLMASVAYLTAWAANKSLIITFDNGSTQSFLLSDKPNVSVADDKLIVVAGAITAQYTLNEVKTFTFADATTGINGVANGCPISRQGDALVVSTPVKVDAYTIDGKRIDIDYVRHESHTVVPLSSLPKGVTLLKIGKQTVKMIK